MELEEIQINERGLSVREKINILIRLVNQGIRQREDYNTLENIPQINGQSVKGNVSLEDIGINAFVEEKIKENNKEYFTAEEVRTLITETFNKLTRTDVDINLSGYLKEEDFNKAIENFVTDTNIKEILSDYAKSTDFADYTKTEDLKENYATKNELYDFVPRETSGLKETDKGRITSGYLYLRLYDQESKEDLKITPSMLMEYLTPKATKTAELEGKRDGRNNVFTAQNSFVLGTSTIWFNGVRLFNEKSYVETDDRTISFKSYIPKETDEILIEAIFKDE